MYTLLVAVSVFKPIATLLYVLPRTSLEVLETDSRFYVYLMYVGFNLLAGVWMILSSIRARTAAMHFGLVFLYIASPYCNASITVVDATAGEGWATILKFIQTESFTPLVFWLFAEKFPSGNAKFLSERWKSNIKSAALISSCILFVANLLVFLIPQSLMISSFVSLFDRSRTPSFFFPIIFLFVLGSTIYLIVQALQSDFIVKRRLKFLSLSVAVGVGPMLVATILNNASSTVRELISQNSFETFMVVDSFLLTLPITCSYSLLNHGVLHLENISLIDRIYVALRHIISAMPLATALIAFVSYQIIFGDSFFELTSVGLIPILIIVLLMGIFFVVRPAVMKNINERSMTNTFSWVSDINEFTEGLSKVSNKLQFSEFVSRFIENTLHSRSANVFIIEEKESAFVDPKGGVLEIGVSSRLLRNLASNSVRRVSLANDIHKFDKLDIDSRDKFWLIDTSHIELIKICKREKLVAFIALNEKQNRARYSDIEFEFLLAVASISSIVCNRFIGDPVDDGSTYLKLTSQIEFRCVVCNTFQIVGDICSHCGGNLEANPLPRILNQRYEICGLIGEGENGLVFLANDMHLGRQVALKTLPSLSPQQAKDLKKEAKAMAQLSHPNLAAVYGVEFYNGLPAIAMEYFPLGTLQDLLETEHEYEISQLCQGLCFAVNAIHEKGIVHHDIKPENVGIGSVGEIKLMDFGLAKFFTKSGRDFQSIESQQMNNSLNGTLAYLPPEVFRLSPIEDKELDIWAISVVVFQLKFGFHPFIDENPNKTAANILQCSLTSTRSCDSEEPYMALFNYCFNKSQSRRPKSIIELLSVLVEPN